MLGSVSVFWYNRADQSFQFGFCDRCPWQIWTFWNLNICIFFYFFQSACLQKTTTNIRYSKFDTSKTRTRFLSQNFYIIQESYIDSAVHIFLMEWKLRILTFFVCFSNRLSKTLYPLSETRSQTSRGGYWLYFQILPPRLIQWRFGSNETSIIWLVRKSSQPI